MNVRSIYGLLLGIFLASSMAYDINATTQIKTINNKSDLQNSIDSIGDNELVYLDLTFETSAISNNAQCGQGWFGPLAHSDSFEFQIKPVAGDNHLLIAIIPGAKTQFPYNAVSCPYNNSNPSETLIRFRGYYIALHHLVPTAVLIEFRPIKPPK